MEERGQRASPAQHADDRSSSRQPAMEQQRDGSDRSRRPDFADGAWRTEDLDFVRDAIRVTYK